MATINAIPPSGTPMIDQRGLVSPEWYRWFVSLLGGANIAQEGEVATPSGSGLEGGGFVADGVTLSIAAEGVTNAMMRDSIACSVIGRFPNSAGAPADIQADADMRVLSREGGALAFRAFINGVSIGPTTAAPLVRADAFETTDTPAASTATVTHSIPITTDAGVKYILLSSTP